MRLDDGPIPEQKPGAKRAVPRWAMLLCANLLLVVISLMVVAIPAEFVFRYRYAHTFYHIRPAVKAVQQYLTLNPILGYTWLPNIRPEQNIQFEINDIKPAPLCTDAFGVINTPEAIAERAGGRAVDVVGIGDSFIEMANRGFYEAFKADGKFYYGLAIHRQCPPQYDSILATWAAELKAPIVIYGVFENDFAETADFLNWRRSGLDWFTYHSGTWCGPPVGVSPLQRLIHRHTRGWIAFLHVLAEKVRGQQASSGSPSEEEIREVATRVRDGAEFARSARQRFVLVLIPSKESATVADTSEANAYDNIIAGVKDSGAEVLDLRPIFRAQENPAGLYYEKDGHWNPRGVSVAAQAIINLVIGGAHESGSH